MHIFLAGLNLYEFLDVFPSSATQPKRARARVTTVWEQMATGCENKNDTKIQIQDQEGPSLRRGLEESMAHEEDELSVGICPRRPYSGMRGRLMATPVVPDPR